MTAADRQRLQLPIASAREALVRMIRENRTVVTVGETGCGKSTQLPQYLLQDFSRIVVTQPRRVAAVSLAKRVSEEIGCALGKEVGYSIRFDDCTSKCTKIRYVTDGVLLRELVSDPLLTKYDVVVLDEAHERSLHTDVLFALIKRTLRNNPSIRVVVMSATLHAEAFSDYFFGAPIAYIEGRTFPVQIFYTSEPQEDFMDAIRIAVLQIHTEYPPGDILAFAPGQEEIESLHSLLLEKRVPDLRIFDLYAALPSEQQQRVFDPCPPGARKVILATNIAETSLTIPGIKYVVDCGLAKVKTYFPRSGLDTLVTSPVSKASARQRMGRAGRESAGICFRLFPEDAFFDLQEDSVPEILRTNLSGVVLQLKAIGIDDVLQLEFLSPPSRESLLKAMELLLVLGALDEKDGSLTAVGKQMAQFPLDPMASKALIAASTFGCLEDMLSLVSMMSVDNVFHDRHDRREAVAAARASLRDPSGDHLTLLNVWKEYSSRARRSLDEARDWCARTYISDKSLSRARDIRVQLRDLAQKNNLSFSTAIAAGHGSAVVLKALTAGYFLNSASWVKSSREFRTTVEQIDVAVHPSSTIFETVRRLTNPLSRRDKKVAEQMSEEVCLLFNEMVMTRKRYMRCVSRVDLQWLAEAAPRLFSVDPLPMGASRVNSQP